MINNDFARGAQNVSRGMTIAGSLILMVCVGVLTVGWWRDGRWFWVAIGIAVVVVNIVLVVLQFRRRTPPDPKPESDDPTE
ncbi:hypothetical protein V1Y59_15010 [Gordonia sp. PKS22-38]|uniref:Uncharacterized protein n=1 Tax=Gordonia prachuapensis TaxID=3115651 RepID=A0ABU7MX62_9ACTN|nr:hypothetical protein [Gordonia sp. PKS22-38]